MWAEPKGRRTCELLSSFFCSREDPIRIYVNSHRTQTEQVNSNLTSCVSKETNKQEVRKQTKTPNNNISKHCLLADVNLKDNSMKRQLALANVSFRGIQLFMSVSLASDECGGAVTLA